MSTSTAVATREAGTNALFARVDKPIEGAMQLADVLVRSKIMGVENPGDALAVVLTCMAEGMTPIEFAKTYHVISGRLSMRADAMLARFLELGGRHEWVESTDEKATIALTIGDESVTVTYTIEDAQRADLVKQGGGWTKTPRAMLRARASSEAVRMLRPQIVAGVYSPEELDEVPASAPVRTEEAIAARREELISQLPESEVVAAEPAVETEPDGAGAATDDQPGTDAPPAPSELAAGSTPEYPVDSPATEAQIERIAELCQQLEIDPGEFCEHMHNEIGVDHPAKLTEAQAARVIANLADASKAPF